MNPRRFLALGLALAFVSGLLACGGARAADPALVAAAEAEGKLVVYGCDPGETPGYIKQFAQRYPKIKVTSFLAGCWQVYNRHTNEMSAGHPVGSLVFAGDDVLVKLQSDGLLVRYDSPEVANFPAWAHPGGVDWVAVKLLVYGMVSNADFDKGLPPATDWLDFANPPSEWHNKVVYFDPRSSSAAISVLAALYQNFGPEQTARIYRGLSSSGADLAPTTPAGLAKMLSGERPIMFYIMSNHFSGALAKGAPLTFTVPQSGAIATPFGIALLKDAPQPNAAKLFIDYILGDAQLLIAQHNEYGARNGLPPPRGMPPLAGIKLLPIDVARALREHDALLAFWKQATGNR